MNLVRTRRLTQEMADTYQRALTGGFFYAAAWLVVGLYGGAFAFAPLASWGLVVAFLGLATQRFVHKPLTDGDETTLAHWLKFHWGVVLLTTLLWVPLSLPAALLVWQWPAADLWPWLALCGALGTGGQYCWTHALKIADASTLAPFCYLQLVIVAALAWLVFGEKVDGHTALGAAIVIGASLYIARREARLAREHRAQVTRRLAQPPA